LHNSDIASKTAIADIQNTDLIGHSFLLVTGNKTSEMPSHGKRAKLVPKDFAGDGSVSDPRSRHKPVPLNVSQSPQSSTNQHVPQCGSLRAVAARR
jgi:hypothetical protein